MDASSFVMVLQVQRNQATCFWTFFDAGHERAGNRKDVQSHSGQDKQQRIQLHFLLQNVGSVHSKPCDCLCQIHAKTQTVPNLYSLHLHFKAGLDDEAVVATLCSKKLFQCCSFVHKMHDLQICLSNAVAQ